MLSCLRSNYQIRFEVSNPGVIRYRWLHVWVLSDLSEVIWFRYYIGVYNRISFKQAPVGDHAVLQQVVVLPPFAVSVDSLERVFTRIIFIGCIVPKRANFQGTSLHQCVICNVKLNIYCVLRFCPWLQTLKNALLIEVNVLIIFGSKLNHYLCSCVFTLSNLNF